MWSAIIFSRGLFALGCWPFTNWAMRRTLIWESRSCSMASVDAIVAGSWGKMGRYGATTRQCIRERRGRKSRWEVVGGEQRRREKKEELFVCSPRSGDGASKQQSVADYLHQPPCFSFQTANYCIHHARSTWSGLELNPCSEVLCSGE